MQSRRRYLLSHDLMWCMAVACMWHMFWPMTWLCLARPPWHADRLMGHQETLQQKVAIAAAVVLWPWKGSLSACACTHLAVRCSAAQQTVCETKVSLGMRRQAVQLQGPSLRFSGGTSGGRALTSVLPLGVSQPHRAARGALTMLLGTRPGSAGTRGGFLSLIWRALETLGSACVSSALQTLGS